MKKVRKKGKKKKPATRAAEKDRAALVRTLEDLDNRIHRIAAMRVVAGEPTRMSMREWERMLKELLGFADTERARRIARLFRF